MHPFDRYAAFTDLKLLKEFSQRPLRKSKRVNTLKTSVESFKKWGKEKGWVMEQIPWCPEGFFIDRENREEALGKDLLHLMGHSYMQEAASMLPVMLLNPQPGNFILDMSAAPGSKTTQAAALMKSKGVIIANDVQEKRLWTLKSSLFRLGVTNAVVTKKVGQWFSKHMTERFDCVLCDAPCTAQGTSRKDSDALMYCSADNIGKMAKLQRELLEAAIHAAKVGGVVVYSTCTLTPEENEEVVQSLLNKFSDQLEVIPPAENLGLQKGIEDSQIVQKSLGITKLFPSVRLWPQTYDTEGFFAVAFRKKARTKDKFPVDIIRTQEDLLPRSRQKEMGNVLEKTYGTSFMKEGEVLFQMKDQLLLATQEVADLKIPLQDFALGMPFALRLDGNRLRVSHELASLRGQEATANTYDLKEAELNLLFSGKDATCDSSLNGDVMLLWKGFCIGVGLAKEGKLKNRLPRWVVLKS